MKRFSLITLIAGLALLITGFALPPLAAYAYSAYGDGGAVAIIGGADGPTATYLSYTLFGALPLILCAFGVAVTITALFCLIFRKTVEENCTVKMSTVSLGISAVGALGIYSFICWFAIAAFNDMSSSPIEYPASIAIGIISFITFAFLIFLYIKQRKVKATVKGVIIDIVLSVLYLMPFLFAFSWFHSLMS